MEALLDIAGLAEKLGVPRTWVRDKVTAREIPFTKIGRHVRFTEQHFQAIVAAGEEPTATTPTRLQVVQRTHPPSGPETPPPPPGPKKQGRAA